MKCKWCVMSVLVLTTIFSAWADNTMREYPVYQVAEAPMLDGASDDAVWKTVPEGVGFFSLSGGGFAVEKPSTFKACWKGDALYLFARCQEKTPDKMKTSKTDGDDIWADDALELFFIPKTFKGYYQLVVNSFGARWNACHDGSNLVIEPAWNWQVKTQVGKDFWAVEMKIPFSVFKQAPTTDETWAFNIARDITTGPEAEKNTCWALVGAYADTKNYARLAFKGTRLTEAEAGALTEQMCQSFKKQLQGSAGTTYAPSEPGTPPLVSFSCNGSLDTTMVGGKKVPAKIEKGKATDIKYVPADIGASSFFSWLLPKKQGVYPSGDSVISIPVENLNPAEGSMCFWFRPDWAVGDFTFHPILEMDASPTFKLTLQKGIAENAATESGYIMAMGGSWSTFATENMFTARQWRHYTIRWSNKYNTLQLLVDGDAGYAGGRIYGKRVKFNMRTSATTKGNLNLPGKACGAFSEVKVFDRSLQVEEILKEAGLAQPVRFSGEDQMPPQGGADSSGSSQVMDFIEVDPASGQKVAASAGGAADSKLKGDIYNPATMPDLPITEHTAWARPLAGGPVRILMIMPTGFYNIFSNLREGVELWQRLDSVCDMVNATPDPAIFEKDYDVIALTQNQYSTGKYDAPGAVDWSMLGDQFRNWIVQRVKTGKSGLILAYPYPKTMDASLAGLFNPETRISADALIRGVPLKSMYFGGCKSIDGYFNLPANYFTDPEAFAKTGIEIYRAKDVRTVKLNYSRYSETLGFTPASRNNFAATDVGYDYWQALLVRAALFAAGRRSDVTITSANVDAKAWAVKLEGVAGKARLWYRARDIWNRVYAIGELDVKTPDTVTLEQVKLPPLAIVDFILKDTGGRVMDWYSASAAPAAETKIASVSLGKDAYAKGEEILGTAGITTKNPGEYTLTAYLGDHESRRLVRNDIKTSLEADKTNQIPFVLKIPESADSLLMRVEIQLSKDGAVIAERSADCPIPKTKFEGFYAVMYSDSNEFLYWQSSRILRDRFLVNTWYGGGDLTLLLPTGRNLNTVDYCASMGLVEDEKTFSDFVDNWETFFPAKLISKELKKKVIQSRPLFWSLGEEHYLTTRMSGNPKANARFRDYMRGKYGSIEKLNSEWNMKCANWDEVSMTTPGMPGFERARFMEHLFADKHAYLADYIRKIDPLGQVGIHAGWDLWMDRGYDYWLLSRGMDSMGCYPGVQNQYARSFFKNYYGHFYHYSIGCVDDVRWRPWEMLISGAHGMSWYTNKPEIWGAITSDLHLGSDWAGSWPEFKAVVEAGDLLSRTEYIQDQVAIHYSQDSFRAGVGSKMSYIHQSFVNLLYDGGAPFKFVSYDQVGDGGLVKGKFPLFIMPHSISLSEKECVAIRDYANNGGVVWADIVPGQFNNFGRKLAESQLIDLFTNMQPLAAAGNGSMKKVGKGLVILADIGNYNYDRNVGAYGATERLLAQVAGHARIARPAKVLDPVTGAMANGVWSSGYRCGNQRYAVVSRDYKLADKDPLKVRIEFDREGHIYEMRSGQYLGLNSSVATKLETARGQVYAILPYQVKDIGLTPKSPVKRGEDLVLKVVMQSGKGAIGKEDLHLLRVNVTEPGGKEVTALRRLVKIYGGQGEIRLPVAFNDQPGEWTIEVRDTATGIRKNATYRVMD